MPSALVRTLYLAPVSAAVIWICALGTTAACSSVTRPVTVALETACAYSCVAPMASRETAAAKAAALDGFMDIPVIPPRFLSASSRLIRLGLGSIISSNGYIGDRLVCQDRLGFTHGRTEKRSFKPC